MSQTEFSVGGSVNYNRKNGISWIISHLTHYPYFILTAVISAVGASMANGYIYFLLGDGFDLMETASEGVRIVLPIVLWIIICAGLEGIFTFFKDRSLQLTGEKLERDMKEEYVISLLGKSQTFFAQVTTGELLANATNDVSAVNTMFSPGLLLILEAVFSIITPVVMIGILNIRLLFIPLLYLLIWGITVYYYNKNLYKVGYSMNEQYGTTNAIAAETISNIELVKGYAKEKQEQERFYGSARRFRKLFIKQGKIEGAFLPNLIYMICLAAGFFHSTYLWQGNVITVGQMITFIGLFKTFELANSLSSYSFVLMQMGIAGAQRMLDNITCVSNLNENKSGYSSVMHGNIAFENISFSMDGNEILHSLNFNINQGEMVAVVGKTGSGKTILTQLINRIFDVSNGKLKVDDVDVKEWKLENLRNQIAFIEQNVFLFSKSIKDNILFGKPDATLEEIKEVAKLAQIDEFITSLPNQYEEILGENGAMLSGGQKQRIAIARALLTDARIIILDAFTSAVDSITEEKIFQSISTIKKGRTIIMITNKINQIKKADRILVLRGGSLIGNGRHEELLKHCEEYRQIYQVENKEGR